MVKDKTKIANNFKKELKELLTKHNADISFSCSDCSDTHGIYEPKIVATIGRETIDLSNGWWVDASDL